MSSPSPPQADRLKAEGNALFVKKDFAGAYKKHTEALAYDDKNAILYSNRAARTPENKGGGSPGGSGETFGHGNLGLGEKGRTRTDLP
jgi:hypothetical protein